MFYLKFIKEDGAEFNTSCASFETQPRIDWTFVTAYKHNGRHGYEQNFCVGNKVGPCEDTTSFYVSMFVMNNDGKTIDKLSYVVEPAISS